MTRAAAAGAARLAVLRLVAIGSTSPAKVAGIEAALREVPGGSGPVAPVKAASGVRDQPVGDEETFRGAANRARTALAAVEGASLGIGIEAGISLGVEGAAGCQAGAAMYTSAWVVAVDEAGVVGSARSAAFALPPFLAARVANGMELGDALDDAYGLRRAKDGPGAAGVLSRGLVTRAELYRQPVLLALLPWLAPAPGEP